MKHTKPYLLNWDDLNQELRCQNTRLQTQCSTLETMHQVTSLTETNFENFLVRNYFRLGFIGGQIYMPVYSGIKTKVHTEGKYAKQC
jgi:hypothetical protein